MPDYAYLMAFVTAAALLRHDAVIDYIELRAPHVTLTLLRWCGAIIDCFLRYHFRHADTDACRHCSACKCVLTPSCRRLHISSHFAAAAMLDYAADDFAYHCLAAAFTVTLPLPMRRHDADMFVTPLLFPSFSFTTSFSANIFRLRLPLPFSYYAAAIMLFIADNALL